MSISLNEIVNVNVSVAGATSFDENNFNSAMIIIPYDSAHTGGAGEHGSWSNAKEVIDTLVSSFGYPSSSTLVNKCTNFFAQSDVPTKLHYCCMLQNETYLEAFNRARALEDCQFYYVMFADYPSGDSLTSTIIAVAGAVEASEIPTVYIFENSNVDYSALKEAPYNRTFGFVKRADSLRDEGTDVAVAGLLCGLNTLKNNSAYTATYKTLKGISSVEVSSSDLLASNKNAYAKFSRGYSFIYPGKSSGGFYFDEIFLMDVAKTLIQNSVLSTLVGSKKVPLTEDGVGSIISAVANACDQLNRIGLISSGIWSAAPYAGLQTGDAIENGYNVDAGSVNDLTSAQRLERACPDIYVALLSSSAIHYVGINVVVER